LTKFPVCYKNIPKRKYQDNSPRIGSKAPGRYMSQEEKIGKRIRKTRKLRGLTLRQLADRTGFTQGYLSKVENSDKSPPVSTLIRLARVLGVSISELFGETETRNPFVLVRRDERREMARPGSEFGYYYETLGYSFAGRHMDPYILTIPAGLEKPELVRHEGEEMVFVLKGRLKFFLGESEVVLQEGDCLYFDSSLSHHAVALGRKEAKILVVIYSPNQF